MKYLTKYLIMFNIHGKIYRNFIRVNIRVEEFSKIEIEHNTTLKMPSKNSSSKSPLSINNISLYCFLVSRTKRTSKFYEIKNSGNS